MIKNVGKNGSLELNKALQEWIDGNWYIDMKEKAFSYRTKKIHIYGKLFIIENTVFIKTPINIEN